MKNTKTIALLTAVVLIFLYAAWTLSHPGKRSAQFQTEQAQTAVKTAEKKLPESTKKHTAITTKEEYPPAQQEDKGNTIAQQTVKEKNNLMVNPETVTIKVAQNDRETAALKITNIGTQDIAVNIYKTEANSPGEKIKATLDEIANYRKEAFAKTNDKNALSKAALFRGAPWLSFSPCYAILKPSQSTTITLMADAKNLEAADYRVDLLMISNQQEPLDIPIYVTVKPASQLRLSRIEIDDGTGPDTKGNTNHVAEPGETVVLTAHLRNDGAATAHDVTLTLDTKNPDLVIIGEKTIHISSLEPAGEADVHFLAQVGANANPQIPPSVTMDISDTQHATAQQNFYLGEPDKIKYPLGLTFNKDRISKRPGSTNPDVESDAGGYQ